MCGFGGLGRSGRHSLRGWEGERVGEMGGGGYLESFSRTGGRGVEVREVGGMVR